MQFAAALHSRLEAAIANDGLGVGAAACHGLVCGLVCGPSSESGTTIAQALALLAEDVPIEATEGETRDLLRHTMSWTAGELEHEDFRLELVLPDDESPLQERAKALGEWVQGYLLGLGLSGAPSDSSLEADVREVLADFGHLAQLDAEVESGEDAERSLVELTEFVRVGAMLVYEAHAACGDDEGE